jgi:cell division protein FtsQ
MAPIDVRLMALITSLLGWLVLAMLVLSLGLWVVRHPIWTLSGIELQGDVSHQDPQRFRAHLVSELKGNFLTVDLTQVQVVAQSVPWVRKAQVKRVFPNRLQVTIEEHQAFAWWKNTDGSALVNAHGEVFETLITGDESDDLPELAGPDTQVLQIKQVYERLRPWFLRAGHVLWRLELTAQGGWQAVLGNGATIELGRGEVTELESRVQRFILTLPKVMTQHGHGLESADLRYPQAYTVRLKGVETAPQSSSGGHKPPPKVPKVALPGLR